MQPNKPIALWGPPGAGKSTLAAQAARLLGWQYLDLDQEIEAKESTTIPALFAQGEDHFRSIEATHAQRIIAPNRVIALGGGTLLDSSLRRRFQEETQLLRVNAPLETLAARVAHQTSIRPLLEGNLKARLEALLQSRQSAYEEIKEAIETHGQSIEQATDRLLLQCFLPKVLQASVGDKEHDVRLGPGLLGALGVSLQKLGAKGKVFVLADQRASAHHGARVKRALSAAGIQWKWISLPPGEQQKSSTRLWWLLRLLTKEGADKGSFLIGFGGGATCDLSALVASLFMRGLPLVLVPTTALAMLDASLGGKTAINEWGIKNVIGTFYAPRLVVADPTTLSSLPVRERRAALAEAVKVALIGDEGLLTLLEKEAPRLIQETTDVLLWQEVIERSARIKLRIIKEDFEEKGPRKLLNLGHTVGHALEACAKDLRHGEAISLGLQVALSLSVKRGFCEASLKERVCGLLQALHLPTKIPKVKPEEMLRALRLDKKNSSGVLSFIICRGIGQVEAIQDASKEELLNLLQTM